MPSASNPQADNPGKAPFRELLLFYRQNRADILKLYKQPTRSILEYNDPDRQGQFLRRPQYEALEIYIFLKEYLNNKTVHDILADLRPNNGPFQQNASKGGHASDEHLLPAHRANDEIAGPPPGQIHANYIFALTMGVGKTLLMATCIFYEFVLAGKFPQDPRFCHNALIFAPDKTVLQSLREIENFDLGNALPPDQANWLRANLKIHYLDKAGATLNAANDSRFNLVISNAQKIILKKKHRIAGPAAKLFGTDPKSGENDAQNAGYDNIARLCGLDEPLDEDGLIANQRFMKLRRLPRLGVYVDEAHHAFGERLKNDLEGATKETSLRFTIEALAQGRKHNESRLAACYNFTGTPYIKNKIFPEVVYAFGLGAAIAAGYLKNPVIHSFANTRDRDFVKLVINDFLEAYKDKRFENMLPKLAFFSPTIEDASQNLRPMLEEELARRNISSQSILMNVGDERLTTNADIKAFNELDSPKSRKQFIILVNKGKEGWNCRSLCGVAMFRKPKSRVFVLQAAMRCLRSIGPKQEEGHIYLSNENFRILDDELRHNFGLDAEKIQKLEKKTELPRPAKTEQARQARRQLTLRQREISFPVYFGLDNWDTDKYRSFHEIQNLADGKPGGKNRLKEITGQKKRRQWTAYQLTAEIALYLGVSPVKIEKLLRESVEGPDAILAKINEFDELLHDKLVPLIFNLLYEVEEYDK